MKKIKEIWKSKIFKTILFLMFELSLAVTGITLLWIYGSWQLALGVFLLMWGNNYTLMNSVRKELKQTLKLINEDN